MFYIKFLSLRTRRLRERHRLFTSSSNKVTFNVASEGMPMKRYSHDEMTEMKEKLYSDFAGGSIGIRDSTRHMRKIIGITQAEYAKNVVKISPRILSDFERGVGNSTLDTLERIGKPFDLIHIVYLIFG